MQENIKQVEQKYYGPRRYQNNGGNGFKKKFPRPGTPRPDVMEKLNAFLDAQLQAEDQEEDLNF